MTDLGDPRIVSTTVGGVDRRLLLACAWSGPVFLVLFVVGYWFLAGLVPPPKASAGAAEVAAFYRDHTTPIRAGMLVAMVGGAFYVPFLVVTTLEMKRRNPRLAPLAYIQLLGGFAMLLMVLLPVSLIAVAAFRPDRPPESIQLLDDIAVLILFWLFSTPTLQFVCLGIYSLMDRSEEPLFPRWAGWYHVAVGVIFATGAPVNFVEHGPFAWHGLLAFWAVLFSFGGWVLVTFFCVLRSLERQGSSARRPTVGTSDASLRPS